MLSCFCRGDKNGTNHAQILAEHLLQGQRCQTAKSEMTNSNCTSLHSIFNKGLITIFSVDHESSKCHCQRVFSFSGCNSPRDVCITSSRTELPAASTRSASNSVRRVCGTSVPCKPAVKDYLAKPCHSNEQCVILDIAVRHTFQN